MPKLSTVSLDAVAKKKNQAFVTEEEKTEYLGYINQVPNTHMGFLDFDDSKEMAQARNIMKVISEQSLELPDGDPNAVFLEYRKATNMLSEGNENRLQFQKISKDDFLKLKKKWAKGGATIKKHYEEQQQPSTPTQAFASETLTSNQ